MPFNLKNVRGEIVTEMELKKSTNNSNKYLVIAGVLVLAFALILTGNNFLGDSSVEESTGEFFHTSTQKCTGGPGKQGTCPAGYICSASIGGTCSKQKTTTQPTNDCKERITCTDYNTLITTSTSKTGATCPATKSQKCTNGCLSTTSTSQPSRCIGQCKDSSGTLLTNNDGSPKLYSQIYSKDTGEQYSYKFMQIGPTLSAMLTRYKLRLFKSDTGDLLKDIALNGEGKDFTISGDKFYVVIQPISYSPNLVLTAYDALANNLGAIKYTQALPGIYSPRVFNAPANNLYLAYAKSGTFYVAKFNTVTKTLTPFVQKAHNNAGGFVMNVKSNGDFAVAFSDKVFMFTAAGQELPSFDLKTVVPTTTSVYPMSLIFEQTSPQGLYVASTFNFNVVPWRESRVIKISPANQLLYALTGPQSEKFSSRNLKLAASKAQDKALFVADRSKSAVWKFDNNGKYVTTVVKNEVFFPQNNTYGPDGLITDVDVDSVGNVYAIYSKDYVPQQLNKYSAC